MKIIQEGRGIVVGFEPFDVSDYPNLKVIGCPATSCEHLPWDEIRKRGIKVISLAAPRDEETEAFLNTVTSTAEHTIGLIIALLRNYKTALNGPYKDRDEYKGHTLADKTLGIYGAGRIGRQVARVARALQMDVFFFHDSDQEQNAKYLRRCDVVSLHIPLAGNEGFFTGEMFTKMKPTSYLINTSRSGVVDNEALLLALENDIIAGAAVDFIDDERLVEYAKDHDNLILTNHIGGCTEEDMKKTQDFIERKVTDYLQTKGLIS